MPSRTNARNYKGGVRMIIRNAKVSLVIRSLNIFGLVITTKKNISNSDIYLDMNKNTIIIDEKVGLQTYY